MKDYEAGCGSAAFNPTTGEAEEMDLCDLRPAWSTKGESRTARATAQRNPVSENKTKQNKVKIENLGCKTMLKRASKSPR